MSILHVPKTYFTKKSISTNVVINKFKEEMFTRFNPTTNTEENQQFRALILDIIYSVSVF